VKPSECILFSGGAPGAEAEFGACAERHGVEEVNFTFEGHKIARSRGVRMLNHEELQAGDVSLTYVSGLLHRRYTDSPAIRKVLQTLWYQVNSGQEIYVIGTILDDKTVRGGTGWGAEFAKLCNKPLHVFDQDKDGWFRWTGEAWDALEGSAGPVITHPHCYGFSFAHAVRVDRDDNIWAVDEGTNVIQKFRNSRIQVLDNHLNLKTIYDHVGAPWAVCISTSGPRQFLYSSNSFATGNNFDQAPTTGEVYKMELDGTVIGRFGSRATPRATSTWPTPATIVFRCSTAKARSSRRSPASGRRRRSVCQAARRSTCTARTRTIRKAWTAAKSTSCS
jgi:hypothetical protein